MICSNRPAVCSRFLINDFLYFFVDEAAIGKLFDPLGAMPEGLPNVRGGAGIEADPHAPRLPPDEDAEAVPVPLPEVVLDDGIRETDPEERHPPDAADPK